MNRRQFLCSAAIVMIGVTLVGDAHHNVISYSKACIPKDIPRAAIIGDCYVLTRGTYAEWAAPGVPPASLKVGV